MHIRVSDPSHFDVDPVKGFESGSLDPTFGNSGSGFGSSDVPLEIVDPGTFFSIMIFFLFPYYDLY